jgi:hypothetical protein
MRFEIEVELDSRICEYAVAFVLPPGSKDLVVFEERLSIQGKPIYSRELDDPDLRPLTSERRLPVQGTSQPDMRYRAAVQLNWRVVALPILGDLTLRDPSSVFKRWLSRMLILAPIPSLITGDSESQTLEPERYLTDLGAWFSGLTAEIPGSYRKIEDYLKLVMPDFEAITNPAAGRDARTLIVKFSSDQASLSLPFDALSDGERWFIISAIVLASAGTDAYNPAFCFWDEPDNYLAPDEVWHFVVNLRRAFQSGGQFIATSHNPEAIRSFSDENTFVLFRKNHFEPTVIRPLHTLQIHGDLVGALTRGDVEP